VKKVEEAYLYIRLPLRRLGMARVN